MTKLLSEIVQAYNEKALDKCKTSLLLLALACNGNISEGKTYNHDLKHQLFSVNFIRNPLGVKYTIEDYSNIQSILLNTLDIIKKINDPEIDTSGIFQKGFIVDNRIVDDLVDLIVYTHVLYQMNQLNSKRMDECETWKLPFVEQMLTILTYFQDQVRLLRQDPQAYLHDDYITGMEFAVADQLVEYSAELTSSISDSLESTLEAMNEIIHYLYFQHRNSMQPQVLNESINFGLIHPYENVDFQRYMYIAAQRHLLCRIEEGIRYGYYKFESTGKQENGIRYFQFSLENEDKYRARRLGVLRREYQYQNHGIMCSITQSELDEAYELINTQADLLIKGQKESAIFLELSQFLPDRDLFQRAEIIFSPKLRVVEQLTKEYYFDCQVKDVKICDLVCAYKYLATLAEIVCTASKELINPNDSSTYVREICLINTSYLSSELSRIHGYKFDYAEKLIDRFVFHEKNNYYDDVFAQPLLKISNTQVVLSQALMEQVNLDRAIERQFIRFNKNVSEVGHKFEREFIAHLSHGYSRNIIDLQRKEIPNFELNTNKIEFVAFDGKDIEFDMIALLGDYIILTELKAVMSSYDLDDLERRKKNVKDAIEQLHRRAESLKYDWDIIRSKVSINLPEKPVDQDHIILVACTDSYDYTPLKDGKVYITDDSTFLKYFTNPYVHILKAEEKVLNVLTVKELWPKGYPDAEEFQSYLLDPVTIHPISDYIIKKYIPGIIMDEQDFLLVYEDYSLSQDPVRGTAIELMS